MAENCNCPTEFFDSLHAEFEEYLSHDYVLIIDHRQIRKRNFLIRRFVILSKERLKNNDYFYIEL
jgi:hypothetical protein